MSVNNDEFIIEQEDIAIAQDICNDIADETVRNRAMANALAAKIAKKYFSDTEIDAESGIHNIAKVLGNIDISDIYINGNYIDVRLYFKENELFVPKSHFDNGILPVAYMFIKLNQEATEGRVTGFVLPEDIDTSESVGEYYVANEDILKSFYDVENRLVTIEDEEYDTDFEKNVYDFLDNHLKSSAIILNTLVKSEIARQFLYDAAKADLVFSQIDTATLMENEPESSDELGEAGTDEDFLLQGNEVDLDSVDEVESIDIIDDDESESLDLGQDAPINEISDADDVESLEEFAPVEDNEIAEQASLEPLSDEEDLLTEDLNPDNNLEGYDMSLVNNDISQAEPLEPADSDGDSLLTDDFESVDTNLEQFDTPLDNNEISEFEQLEPSNDDDNSMTEIQEPASELPDSSLNEPVATDAGTLLNNGQSEGQDIDENIAAEKSTEKEDDFEEFSKFDYSTEIMPSMNTIEAGNQEGVSDSQITEEMLDASEKYSSNNNAGFESNTSQNSQQIENLFANSKAKSNIRVKKKGSILPLLGFLIIAGALGYWGYTKYFAELPEVNNSAETNTNVNSSSAPANQAKPKDEAMPIETVENANLPKRQNEAVSVAIPAIEQNLNASIDVSNLAVNWEVPANFASNTTAKRYFFRIGKILQLNLKTELLMVSSPPITNKITIELEFNKDNNKFGISKIIDSSGVPSVDNTIKETVNKVLGMSMNMNMSVFNNLQGNPVLVIKL